MIEHYFMGKVKTVVGEYAEANDMTFGEAEEALAQPGKLEEAYQALGAIGVVYLSRNSREEREFAIPYTVKGQFLLYHELFVYPDKEASPGYVVVRQESNDAVSFHQFWQVATPEQAQKAIAASRRGQQVIVARAAEALQKEEAILSFFNGLADRDSGT